MRFAELSNEEMRQEQVRRLRRLLCHARDTVPYWRATFAESGLEPNDLSSSDDLAVLPILSKAQVRALGDQLVSGAFDKRRLLPCTTGGTTGEPLRFFKARQDFEGQMALQMRHLACLGYRVGDRTATIWGYHRSPVGNLIAPITGRLFLNAFYMQDHHLARWARWVCRMRPRLLYGYTSAIAHFARFMDQRGLGPIPGLEMIVTTSEKLYGEQRTAIEASLGGRVFDEYGAHEVPLIASECDHGSMHLALDSVVVEFVPDAHDTLDSPPRIILTPLVAQAQPFIRYDIGDRAHPLPGRCACGSAFPRIGIDVGKEHLLFSLTNGRQVNSVYFFKHVYPLEGIRPRATPKTGHLWTLENRPLTGRD